MSTNGLTENQKRRAKLRLFLWYTFLGFLGLLLIGMIGFRYIVGTNWIDAFYNASLHFAGADTQAKITTTPQKIFVALYALVAGFLFVGLAVFVIDQVVDLQFLE